MSAVKSATSLDTDREFELLPVATLLVRRRKPILVFLVVAIVLGVTHGLLAPPRYTASTTFVVAQSQATNQLGALGALASRFGASAAGLNASGSPRLFQAAITSREVLNGVLDTTLQVRPSNAVTDAAPMRIDLLDWYRIDDGPPALRLEDGRKALADRMVVAVDDRTGIVTLKIDDRDPNIAASVARALVDGLNRFNLQTRQSTFRATRIFLEHRLGEVWEQLRQAENALRTFLQTNRRVTDSPQLQLEQQRLQRQIELVQEVYQELARELEQARSDEVRDTPVLTVIQQAIPPARRSWPRRKLIVLGWFVVGLLSSLVWIAVGEWVERSENTGGPSWLDFKGELARAMRGLARWSR